MLDGVLGTTTVGASSLKITHIGRDLGRAVTGDPRRSHLVVAGSGGGKTHTLDAILVEVRRRRPSALILQPDTLGVGSYADLLYESLRTVDPAVAERDDRNPSNWLAFENLLTEVIGTRPTVLVIDDFDHVLSRMEPAAHYRLRDWTDRCAAVAILASASTTTNPAARARRSWRWLSMFDVADLPPLTIEDAELLLRREFDAGRREARQTHVWRRQDITDMYTRLGGNPRVWTMIAVHLASSDSVDEHLPAVLEKLAPFYLPRLLMLSPLSSRLLIALARAETPLTVTVLASRVGLTHQNTAAALSRLTATHWVSKQRPSAELDQRNRLYAVAEPPIREFIRYRDTAYSRGYVSERPQ
jgi:hypothetical protein